MDVRQYLLVGGLLALVGSFPIGCGNETSAIDGAESAVQSSTQTPRVKTLRPVVKSLRRTTTQPVAVFPYHDADIDAKVSGYLTALNVDIGDRVEQGDVLAVPDVPEMVKDVEEHQAVITRLHAEERQAAAQVELAAANVGAAQAMLAQADAGIQKADADVSAERAELQRIEDLVSRRSIEARMQDEARQRFEAAQAAKSASEAALASAQANITVAEARLDAAKADVDRAEAETAIAEKQLEKLRTLMEYTSLTAPFSGVVTARNVDLGDLVRNAQAASGPHAALFTVAQVDRVRVRAAIPEDDAPWTTVGDAVTVRLTALRNQAFPGTISRVTKSLDPGTRTMLAEIDLDNPDGQLLPGMYGEAAVVLDEKENALVLPASAVRFDVDGKAYVYKVDMDETVQVVDVSTGIDDGHEIEILGGISADDRIIDGMIGRLAAGQTVRVEE